MIRHRGKLFLFVTLLAGLVLTANPVEAQNYFMNPGERTHVSLELLKPKFDHWDAFNFATSTFLLSGGIRACDRLTVILDFSVANLDVKDSYGGDNATTFGNPYIGLEYELGNTDGGGAFLVRAGIRPPIASDDEYGVALIGM